jgi:hypothetical protein
MDSSQPPFDLSRHLLPGGSKDLAGVPPSNESVPKSIEEWFAFLKKMSAVDRMRLSEPFPRSILKQVSLPARIKLRDLALNLGVDPRKLQRALATRSMHFTFEHELEFAIAALICKWCGVSAIRDDRSICAF